ncbi:MAG: antitermination protein NusG [Planctomycetota bacterium]|jgi:transcriptional antiterminator RfaH|nr:antitermination protein NusG [Planctomycetota bacterium]MDA1212091.1 antitermination protein NusG [Planctomycetota bacterium]
MPILAREPELYPDDLLDRPEVGTEASHRWWVVHTKPRQEKALARYLTELHIGHYVPQMEQKTRSPKGRTRVSFVPMFTSYGFVYCTADERMKALDTYATANLLEVKDNEQLTFDLRQIRRLSLTGQILTPENRLEPGMPVRITSGPFTGFEGRILKRRTGDHLLVMVNYLQRGISVELGDYHLERLT